ELEALARERRDAQDPGAPEAPAGGERVVGLEALDSIEGESAALLRHGLPDEPLRRERHAAGQERLTPHDAARRPDPDGRRQTFEEPAAANTGRDASRRYEDGGRDEEEPDRREGDGCRRHRKSFLRFRM